MPTFNEEVPVTDDATGPGVFNQLQPRPQYSLQQKQVRVRRTSKNPGVFINSEVLTPATPSNGSNLPA